MQRNRGARSCAGAEERSSGAAEVQRRGAAEVQRSKEQRAAICLNLADSRGAKPLLASGLPPWHPRILVFVAGVLKYWGRFSGFDLICSK